MTLHLNIQGKAPPAETRNALNRTGFVGGLIQRVGVGMTIVVTCDPQIHTRAFVAGHAASRARRYSWWSPPGVFREVMTRGHELVEFG